MREPHLPGFCFGTDGRCLIHHHVFVFLCIFELVTFSVHALANKKISVCCHFRDCGSRTGVCAVGDTKSASGSPHNHIGGVNDTVLCGYGLSVLQFIPVFKRYILLFRFCCIKFTQASDAYLIAITDYFMIDLKGIDNKWAKLQLLNRLFKFVIYDLKGKFRRNYAESVHNSFKTLWSHKVYGFCTLCIAYGQKHPG